MLTFVCDYSVTFCQSQNPLGCWDNPPQMKLQEVVCCVAGRCDPISMATQYRELDFFSIVFTFCMNVETSIQLTQDKSQIVKVM